MTERPYPQPDGDTQPFWEAIAEGRLLIQRCAGCGRHVFYPRAVCPHCMEATLEWVQARGRGTVYSYTVVHRAPPGFDETLYVVALVELVEGVRLMTQLVDVAVEDVAIDLEVEVTIRGEPPLPYFAPIGDVAVVPAQ